MADVDIAELDRASFALEADVAFRGVGDGLIGQETIDCRADVAALAGDDGLVPRPVRALGIPVAEGTLAVERAFDPFQGNGTE